MKIFFIVTTILLTAICLLLFNLTMKENNIIVKEDHEVVTASINKETFDNINNDIQNRYVLLNPQGHLWMFSSDQKTSIEIMEVKNKEDTATISIHIHSVANVPDKNDKDKKINLILSGIAKLYYDLIADKWHLKEIESVNLLVTEEK